MSKTKSKSVAEYIAAQPRASQPALRRVRSVIRKALPGAEEVISYGIPAYRMHAPNVESAIRTLGRHCRTGRDRRERIHHFRGIPRSDTSHSAQRSPRDRNHALLRVAGVDSLDRQLRSLLVRDLLCECQQSDRGIGCDERRLHRRSGSRPIVLAAHLRRRLGWQLLETQQRGHLHTPARFDSADETIRLGKGYRRDLRNPQLVLNRQRPEHLVLGVHGRKRGGRGHARYLGDDHAGSGVNDAHVHGSRARLRWKLVAVERGVDGHDQSPQFE